MTHDYLTYWNFGSDWLIWFGVWFLLISSFGYWCYAHRVKQRYATQPGNNALDIRNERFACDDVTRDEYSRMK